MLDYSELKKVVDNIENNKNNRWINFITKHPAARIYGKIGRIECQLVVDIRAEVSVCTKSMVNLLKLKLKSDKTMTIVTINRVKQKSFGSVRMVIIKVMN